MVDDFPWTKSYVGVQNPCQISVKISEKRLVICNQATTCVHHTLRHCRLYRIAMQAQAEEYIHTVIIKKIQYLVKTLHKRQLQLHSRSLMSLIQAPSRAAHTVNQSGNGGSCWGCLQVQLGSDSSKWVASRGAVEGNAEGGMGVVVKCRRLIQSPLHGIG